MKEPFRKLRQIIRRATRSASPARSGGEEIVFFTASPDCRAPLSERTSGAMNSCRKSGRNPSTQPGNHEAIRAFGRPGGRNRRRACPAGRVCDKTSPHSGSSSGRSIHGRPSLRAAPRVLPRQYFKALPGQHVLRFERLLVRIADSADPLHEARAALRAPVPAADGRVDDVVADLRLRKYALGLDFLHDHFRDTLLDRTAKTEENPAYSTLIHVSTLVVFPVRNRFPTGTMSVVPGHPASRTDT